MIRWFADTFLLSVREPKRFYGTVPRATSTWAALAYGLVFELVVAVLTFAYQAALGDDDLRTTLAGFPVPPELLASLRWTKFVSLAFAPISYLLEDFSVAAMTWVGLRLTKNLRTSFWVLVRVFAFASWVRIFSLLGVSGEVILSLLAFLVTFGLTSWYWLVAVRETQQITTGRAVVASLAGAAITFAFGCVVGVPLLMALAFWGISQFDLSKVIGQ